MGFVYQGPFERGNRDVKRGNEFQWNTCVRYMFSDLPLILVWKVPTAIMPLERKTV